ncbi:MAG: NAD(P)-dependent oxidoreductase [Actinobacteria bacterium]|nr:NAD(P)-dependent oxidoreductase [Actinomycetota bacterium]
MSDRSAARRIMITGATGLLGRELVDHLIDRGDEVVALTHDGNADLPSRVISQALDLSRGFSTSDLPSGGFDAIVHLAQHASYGSFPRDAAQLQQ